MSAPSRRRSSLVAVLIGAGTLVLGTGVAWAAPEGRIQGVTSTPGEVSFALAAEGLAEGESINPGSVEVTIGGISAPAAAKPITDETAAPVSRTVMLVLDASGSMGDFNKLDIAKSAANSYLTTLPADVQAGLVSFSDTAEVKVAPTLDRAQVIAAVNELQAGGGTALNDAVILTVDALGDQGSRNAVLLSDGNDADSTASAKEARAVLADSGVVLDAVSLGEGSQEKSLAAFAKAGNGSVVTATNSEALTAAFESAARTVASQLAVTAQVPEGVEAGTAELTVTALVGDQQITDTAAALVSPAAPSAAASDAFGPVAVEATDGGVLSKPWFLAAVIAAIFVALASIMSLAVGAIDSKNRKEGRVSRRLEEVSMMGAPLATTANAQPETVLGESTAVRRAVSFAERVAATRDTTAIARKLEEANVSLRPGEWVVVHVLIAILAGLLATLFTGFNVLLSVIAFVLGLVIPWMYLGYRANRRKAKFYEELPEAMQMLAGSLSAGYSLPQALDNVARESTGPLGQELNRALLESRLGLPIEEALEAVAQRMDSKDFHWVVMAIRINRRIGGNLAEVLTNVGKTLRERERLRRQVKTLSAEGRLSGWILGALPILLIGFMVLVRPEYIMPLLTQPIGWVILAAGLVAYIIGIVWMRNLVNMEV